MESPKPWGLRGDPYLWEEMKIHFNSTPIPESETELENLIKKAFYQLTGRKITTDKHFKIDKFNHGGMSGGYISPEFWRKKAIPYLRIRYQKFV